MELPPISESDMKKIDRQMDISDFPIHNNYDEIRAYIKYIKSKYWRFKANDGSKCSFCKDLSEYYNKYLTMDACVSCFSDIRDGEIDVINTEGHAVSAKIREKFCDWIDREWYNVAEDREYFYDYEIEYNICYICRQTIEKQPDFNKSNEWIGIAITPGYEVAHLECCQKHGFRGCYDKESYSEIIKWHLLEEFEEPLYEEK